MKLVPVNGYVLIEPYQETQRASGLIIADTGKSKPMRGTVIGASGEWSKSVGTEVMYSKFGAIEVRYDDTDYVMVRERDILAAIDDAV
jgi:chaperonin GroES